MVDSDSIDGFKIDLQITEGVEPYSFDGSIQAYNSKSASKARGQEVVVHQIVI